MLTFALAVEFEFVLSTIPEGCSCCHFNTLGKHLLFTKYRTSTNIHTAQQKNRALNKKKLLVPHCPDKRGSTVYINKSLQLCNKLQHLNKLDCTTIERLKIYLWSIVLLLLELISMM